MGKTGAELIAEERRRQIEKEGWSQWDDRQKHSGGELAIAAACYAAEGTGADVVVAYYRRYMEIKDAWPWHPEWDKRKKHDKLRRLVIAGALIAAEIDRLKAEEEENG